MRKKSTRFILRRAVERIMLYTVLHPMVVLNFGIYDKEFVCTHFLAGERSTGLLI